MFKFLIRGEVFAGHMTVAMISFFLFSPNGYASTNDCNDLGNELKEAIDYLGKVEDYSVGSMDYAISNLDTTYYHSKTFEGRTVYIPYGTFQNVKVASDNVFQQKVNARDYFSKLEKDLINILEAIAKCK